MTSWKAALLAVAIAMTGAGQAHAATLLMLERKGCVYCARWSAEIGEVYPNTEEGRRAPLRRIDIAEPWPNDLSDIERDIVTPTFVLIKEGREIARLRGYPGDNFFWPMLARMLAKLP